MNATGTITMTMRELDSLKVIQAAVATGLKSGRAAERLGLTVGQSALTSKPASASRRKPMICPSGESLLHAQSPDHLIGL
ncbi:hypothetical protein C6V06_28480 [Burkholderia gladioli]|nr:hypothetical protein C6V06_28480 [Burkholderia gladioli]